VTFTDVGLTPAVGCFDTCTKSWSRLIQGSLREFIDTGRTDPIVLGASAA
jgi:hypothetical protein